MKISAAQIKNHLQDILDDSSIIIDKAQMYPFTDEPRKRFFEKPLAILLPKNVEQLQKIVRFANEHEIPLIAQGGNSGLVGGQVARFGNEIIINLSKLNKVREVNIEANMMVVEAGFILQQVHELAQKHDMLFPLNIASKGSAQIGGIMATNAGGAQALAYGVARDLCLGIEAVMADGSLYQGLKYLKKDNSGYDLKNLLIGSEGTLAIITAVSLKIIKQPVAYETALVAIKNPQAAYELFRQIGDKANSQLTAFELIPRFGIDMQLKHQKIKQDPSVGISPYYALVEISHFENENKDILMHELELAFENELIGEATSIAQSESERQEFWLMREQMSEVQSLEGASIKHDISVPLKAVPELIEKGIAKIAKIDENIRPCPFGHMGDGNIHFNFSQPIGMKPEEFMAMAENIHKVIYDIVIELNGSISAEHGIGQLKIELLEQVKDPVELRIMKEIKMALDPKNILNPGKMLK